MKPVVLVLLAVALGVDGCGAGAQPPGRHTPAGHQRPAIPVAARSAAGLSYSTASAQTVQPQPRSGSCHARGQGVYKLPDPRCTPGALNPAVTQSDIDETICVAGWTDRVRPPEAVTETEKRASMVAYDYSASIRDYEYDHLVPLELGGAVNDPRNLWPEPGASPNPKDQVEEELNRAVCDGRLRLHRAQRAIATDWLTAPGTTPGPELGDAPPSTTPAAAPSTAPSASAAATCSASAANSGHHDYDVYVHSDEPNMTVSVTASVGGSASLHTDASGYADVYLKDPRDTAG